MLPDPGVPPGPVPAPATSGQTPATGGSTSDGGTASTSSSCLTVAGALAGVSFLPLSAAVGATDSADLDKAKAAIREAMSRVPDELKPDFAKLSEVVDAMGGDLSKFDTPAFEEAVKPISAWLEKNCGG
ncbi:hypothetical protein ACQCSX_15580 [Pseudarthrobacter sp. P1]|uniref:hypothetical protein n=1 Tax=Pseudarthrobacter sp. P1 TaxID=3418418 RepID=UPI003CECB0FE